ncbi:selenocysteine-specific translation elongation factor [Ornithinimicrobium avium]|uniref:Translation elongation factor n=1 Tax=Ornithinimicrobium avium TaxID=2283195 RepID=A0A345NND6_9MICO|nr:SelB C-terminal domain-containing protein [Ornithinimicrobium avium]AXH96544.1 translation elongation factor [Ornithinimicrobium avium]
MRRVLATAGHVDHGKSALVRALTGRDPDRLAAERARGLTIELGFAWTSLPGGAEVALVDVPGHQRFVGTTLAGLGPAPAVLFVVAADQGWQAQSTEHLAVVRALGITDGLLVLTRADLADPQRSAQVGAEAARRLAGAGLEVPSCTVSARTGQGMDGLRVALAELVARLPEPDAGAPVRLWCDRSFTVAGSGTVVTGTLGAGTLHTGDVLELLPAGGRREVVVRGLHSGDVAHEVVGPVSRVAANLRRTGTGDVGRGSVLVTPGAFAVARVLDVALTPEDLGVAVPAGVQRAAAHDRTPPEQVVLHVGTADQPVRCRPLGDAHARLTLPEDLPWRVGDRAVLRDPGSRRVWALRVLDVDPLPLRRRGAARHRAEDLAAATTTGEDAGSRAVSRGLADLRVRSRSAEHPDVLRRLGLGRPTSAVHVGGWWVDEDALRAWADRLAGGVRGHRKEHPLSAGVPVAEAVHLLDLPPHLRAAAAGGTLAPDLAPPGGALVRAAVELADLAVDGGRVHPRGAAGLGAAEAGVAQVERRLRQDPFAAPEREDLARLGLGPAELAAAARLGRLLRVTDDIVLLPDGPARAMRELAALEQPFTLSAARQALGTTRRVAVPLLEHLDTRGWTRRVDGRLREVVR